MVASIYYELSRIAYYQSKLDLAIENVELGIQSFQNNGIRLHVYHYLMTGRIIYLKKQGKIIEAYKRLEDLKKSEVEVESTSIVLTRIVLETELLNELGYYKESIEKALYGLNLARVEKKIERSFELYCVLGTSYMHLKEWKHAKICFNEALHIKDLVRKDLRIIPLEKLGQLSLSIGDTSKAIELYEETRELCDSVGDWHSYCKVCIELGNIYINLNQRKRAVTCYDKAINIASKHDFKDLLLSASLKFLSCDRKQGSDKIQKIVDNIAWLL